MSNLNFTDRDLLEMEKYASPAANREPYHLTYARIHKDTEILNPHLPGNRNMAAGQEGEINDERQPEAL